MVLLGSESAYQCERNSNFVCDLYDLSYVWHIFRYTCLVYTCCYSFHSCSYFRVYHPLAVSLVTHTYKSGCECDWDCACGWFVCVMKWLRVRLCMEVLCECIISIPIQESMLRTLGTCSSVKNCSVCTCAVQSRRIHCDACVCVHVWVCVCE